MTAINNISPNDQTPTKFNYNTNTLKNNKIDKNLLLDTKERWLKYTFAELIDNNFTKKLDYVLAVVTDEEGNTSYYDGCHYAAAGESHGFRGKYNPSTNAFVKEVNYYYLTHEEGAEFIPLGEEKKIFLPSLTLEKCYVYANAGLAPLEERIHWTFLYGLLLYEKELYAAALHSFFRAAEEGGHPEAKLMIGKCYEEGKGVEKPDLDCAAAWYVAACYNCTDINVLLRAGEHLLKLQKFPEAYMAYEKAALTKNPIGIGHYIDLLESSQQANNLEHVKFWRKELPTELQELKVPLLIEKARLYVATQANAK